MLYVLLILVVVLALVSGAEYAMLRVAKAERRAEVAELKNANHTLGDKCKALCKDNAKLAERIARMESVEEGLV